MTGISSRKTALFARATTATLCKALKQLQANPRQTREAAWAHTELITEIERRCPHAAQTVADFFDTHDDATADDYVRILTSAAQQKRGL